MKAYELKALLATLDDCAEVSIVLSERESKYQTIPIGEAEENFDVCCRCNHEAALVLPLNAFGARLSSIAEVDDLHEEINDLERELDKIKSVSKRLILQLGEDFERITQDLKELL